MWLCGWKRLVRAVAVVGMEYTVRTDEPTPGSILLSFCSEGKVSGVMKDLGRVCWFAGLRARSVPPEPLP
eukprot:1949092-Prymnesium_polylepis.1